MNNEYIEIGKIVNTFGIKGELKVQSKSDFLSYRFRVGAVIYLKMGQKRPGPIWATATILALYLF